MRDSSPASAVAVDGDRGSRDHTERLLRYLGAEIEWNARIDPLSRRHAASRTIEVAGDFSAAAFFITAAAITPGSAILVRDVGVNPTRTGLLDALRAMGASIELRNQRTRCGEPVADIAVAYRAARAARSRADIALRAIDEIPLLASPPLSRAGTTTIAGVADLRTKESDRIAAIERLLDAVGIAAALRARGSAIAGGDARAARCDSSRRTATIASPWRRPFSACAAGPLAIDSDASLDVSFPGLPRRWSGLRAA